MINNFINKGCENFIFQEYDNKTLTDDYGHSNFKEGGIYNVWDSVLETMDGFNKKWYRTGIPSYIKLGTN